MGMAGEPGSDTFDAVGLIADFDRRVSSLSFDDIARGALSFMSERLGIARASVALVREEGPGFRLFDATMAVQGVESGKLIPPDSATLGETVREKRSVYRPDLRAWPRDNPVDRAFLAHGLRCTFSTPLLSGDRCLGTLNAAVTTEDGLPSSVRQVIERVAPRLAFALEVGLAHAALAESEARFRDIFETVGDAIIVADTTNRALVMVNAAACTMLKRTREELLTLRVNDLHPPERVEEVVQIFLAMVRGDLPSALEIPILRGDGGECLADVTARNTTIGGRRCVVGVFRDAAARRQREQDRLQVQQLESIRTLAAGIAHDFNNLLTGILGNVSLAGQRGELPPEIAPLLAEAERATTRAAGLTRQLLTFTKGGEPVRGEVDLACLVRESAQQAVQGSRVRCQFAAMVDAWPVMADAAQLGQVFQNLVRNAVEAMPDGGVVTLRLERRNPGGSEEACVTIADQGPGIPAGRLEQIFLPFFSTKQPGRGLGLSVAYSIVRNHGGTIQVVSERGQGATFRVVLPAIPVAGPPRAATGASPETRGRVMVMDDEPLVLEVAARILRRYGYEVTVAANGDAAITHYTEALARGQRFDLVVLDLTVPGGMGGLEAAGRLRALDGSARLVVSSGYSDDRVIADHTRFGFQAVLPKPYSAQQLREVVAQVLAGPG